MATVFDNDEQLKAAIEEVLRERKDLIREILEEIIEDSNFSKAIEEGMTSAKVSREEVFELLETAN